MKITALFSLFLFVSVALFAQENQDKYNWSICLANGYSYNQVNSDYNLLGASSNHFFSEQKEYFFLRPSIRLNTNKLFWGFEIRDFN